MAFTSIWHGITLAIIFGLHTGVSKNQGHPIRIQNNWLAYVRTSKYDPYVFQNSVLYHTIPYHAALYHIIVYHTRTQNRTPPFVPFLKSPHKPFWAYTFCHDCRARPLQHMRPGRWRLNFLMGSQQGSLKNPPAK